MHTVGSGIWWENWKRWIMRHTLYDLENANKLDKRGKWESHMVRCEIWRETLKNMQNEKHCTIWNMARNSEKREIGKIHILGPGLWQENWQTWKMRHKHSMTWKMVRHTEKREKWDMHTVGPLIWQEKNEQGKWETHIVEHGIWRENWQMSKMRNTHCSTWNMLRNTKNREKWEMHTVEPEIWWETVKNVKYVD